ncbi:dTDP-4-dehydrorhamnose reductase, partial [Candidatus Latescibacterota bacterium]
MSILLLGKNGQLGWELHRCLSVVGDVTALDFPDIDLTDVDQLRDTVRSVSPRLIVNAAAYTAVDRAESEPDIAMAINAHAPAIIAEEAVSLDAALIHFSTDYVFDGAQESIYTEDDTPNPLNVYGHSKLSGETAVIQSGCGALVFRTSLVYSMRCDCFVTSVLKWARERETLRIVTDQTSNPTWCRMLAGAVTRLVGDGWSELPSWVMDRRGVYHLAGDGFASRYDLAREIIANVPDEEELRGVSIERALTSEFPAQAERPLFSALDCTLFEKTFGFRLPIWKDALVLAM